MIVPIDHGNRNMKTEHEVFTSGYVESDCKPVMGDYLFYNGKYYILSKQRILYMKDKTADDRFFILTLFAIAMEAKRSILTPDTALQVGLPVGLPPKHYGALYTRFEEYFTHRGRQLFIYKGTEYSVDIIKAVAYPQDYAAVMTQYGTLRGYGKLLAVDLGGLTLDYLMINIWKVPTGLGNVSSLMTSAPMRKDTSCFMNWRKRKVGNCVWDIQEQKRKIPL